MGLVLQSLSFNTVYGPPPWEAESWILGHPILIQNAFALGSEFDVLFRGGTAKITLDDHAEPLVAADGARFLGEPVISFAIQQFSNGTLIDDQGQNVLSNYRRTELPRQTLLLLPPN